MRHFYATQVKAVGQGVIMSSDGKTLTCIGSVPVQVGDTVYTDGRVVYGHVPIKASGAVFNPIEQLVPFDVGVYTAWDPPSFMWGGFTRSGKQRLYNQKLNQVISPSIYWMYVYKDKVYGRNILEDYTDYIDVWCSSGTVYSAEFTLTDRPWAGKQASATGQRRLMFYAHNFYMRDTENYVPTFTPNEGEVLTNPAISIKRNGVVVQTFALGDYTDTLEDLKAVYLQYDESGDDITRYRYTGEIIGESGLFAYDVWCSYIYTQLLSFAFTGNSGAWEMVVLSVCEGYVAPHTVDSEYNYDTGEYEDVYSVYGVSCPVLFKVIKITSTGRKEILQERKFINRLIDNNVDLQEHPSWANAASHTVEQVAYVNEPFFTLNFGDCSITTNLRRVGEVRDSAGRIITRNVSLGNFLKLLTTDPDPASAYYYEDEGVKPGAAIGVYREYRLDINRSNVLYTHSYVGFNSWKDGHGPAVSIVNGHQTVLYGTDRESLIERVSIYQFNDGSYLVCLRNDQLILVRPNGRQENIGWYPYMLNLEIVRVGRQKKLGSMTELIAAVTRASPR